MKKKAAAKLREKGYLQEAMAGGGAQAEAEGLEREVGSAEREVWLARGTGESVQLVQGEKGSVHDAADTGAHDADDGVRSAPP